jgi:hypothetical protein
MQKPSDMSMEQYHIYMELLRQASFQRLISNYFFIFINTLILLANFWIESISIHRSALSTFLSVIGVLLCIYWFFEIRELRIIHEVRYRTLLELERKFFPEGVLNAEWVRMGNYPFRRSPVFYIVIARWLPIFYIGGHLLPVITLFL